LRLKPDPALFDFLVAHVDSMARLVEDLRILGMFSASKLELTTQSVDLAEEVAARLRSGRRQAAASLLKCFVLSKP